MAQSIGVITPSSAYQGDNNLNIDISGQNTNFDMATNTVWFDQGSSTIIYANSVTVISPINLTTDFSFYYAHPTGYYNVNIYNDIDGLIYKPNGFYLYPGPNPPAIIQISPDSAFQGQVLSVDITGQNTNFGMGTTTTPVWFTQGTSTIDADTVMLNTLTSLTANFSIPFNAALGYWDISVYSPLDDTVTMTDGFKIYWDPSSIEFNGEQFGISLKIHPNPVVDYYTIQYELKESAQVRMEIFDVSGKLVKMLVNQYHNPGKYSIFETCTNLNLFSQIYFLKLKVGDKERVIRFMKS